MDLTQTTLLIIGLLLVLLAGGLEIAFSLGVVGLLGLYFWEGRGMALGAAGSVMWTTSNSFVLTAVPLFIFMGAVLLHGGISEGLYGAATKWVGRLPGGLAVSSIGACAVFAAVSGSSTATAATIGIVAIPEMEKRGYDKELVFGTLAAGGTLGILIPPSIPMIIYGAMTDQSVGRLYMAGFIPGILLSLIFSAYIVALACWRPHLAPRAEPVRWGDRLRSVKDLVPTLTLIFIVLGGIYLGVTTPTEAAGVGAFAAVLFALLNRRLSLRVLRAALRDTAQTTCMILLIVVGALILSHFLSRLGVPRAVVSYIGSLGVSPWVIFAGLTFMYIIMGCLLDPISMMVITLPTVYPLIVSLGFDPIWFGIVLVILIEMGLITPPVGLNLYVIQGIGKVSIGPVARGSAPFVALMLLGLIIVAAFPQLALWLPSIMMGR